MPIHFDPRAGHHLSERDADGRVRMQGHFLVGERRIPYSGGSEARHYALEQAQRLAASVQAPRQCAKPKPNAARPKPPPEDVGLTIGLEPDDEPEPEDDDDDDDDEAPPKKKPAKTNEQDATILRMREEHARHMVVARGGTLMSPPSFAAEPPPEIETGVIVSPESIETRARRAAMKGTLR